MIKINLLGEEPQSDFSAVVWIIGMGVSLLVLFATAGFLYTDVYAGLDMRRLEFDLLSKDLAVLKEKTREVQELEEKRRELEQKLSVIKELRLNKLGPVKVLDQLNVSVPERAWLTEVSERSSMIEITGYAIDGQTVASFMDQLERSDYFGDLTVDTRAETRDGVKLQLFTLRARLSYAGALRSEPDSLLSARAQQGEKEKEQSARR
ncbi:MAG: PilN domain-containing protein [Bdellovibrionota bacterium]|jgi:type IV pilus assembly protein PilN